MPLCFYIQVEKRRLFHIFLKQFIIVYRDWQPINPLQSPEDHGLVQPVDSQHIEDVVVGCSFGHPSEIIAVLIDEVARMITLVNERKLVLHPRDLLIESCVGEWCICLYLTSIRNALFYSRSSLVC